MKLQKRILTIVCYYSSKVNLQVRIVCHKLHKNINIGYITLRLFMYNNANSDLVEKEKKELRIKEYF